MKKRPLCSSGWSQQASLFYKKRGFRPTSGGMATTATFRWWYSRHQEFRFLRSPIGTRPQKYTAHDSGGSGNLLMTTILILPSNRANTRLQ